MAWTVAEHVKENNKHSSYCLIITCGRKTFFTTSSPFASSKADWNKSPPTLGAFQIDRVTLYSILHPVYRLYTTFRL